MRQPAKEHGLDAREDGGQGIAGPGLCHFSRGLGGDRRALALDSGAAPGKRLMGRRPGSPIRRIPLHGHSELAESDTARALGRPLARGAGATDVLSNRKWSEWACDLGRVGWVIVYRALTDIRYRPTVSA